MNNQDELQKILEDLNAEHNIEEKASFSEIDIAEKLRKNDMMVLEYKKLYYTELAKYEELEDKMNKLKGILYKHYRFEDEREWQKKEIEEYCIPSDPKYIQMKKIMAKQQMRVRFFDMCWRAFNSMGWNMKTYTERDKMGL